MATALKEKFQKTGLTLKDIALQINKSVSTVSDVVNDKYTPKNSLCKTAVIRIIDNALKNCNEKENNGFSTLAQEKILDRLYKMKASKLCFFEAIIGDSGVGKTMHIARTFAQASDVLYLKARRSQSANAFLTAGLKALGIKAVGNTDAKLEMLCEALEDKEYVAIVIDEADLFTMDSDATFSKKFELLREIYEYFQMIEKQMIVVVIGLPALKTEISKQGGYVHTRLTYSPEVTIAKEELEQIAAIKGIKNKAIVDYLKFNGNARLFDQARKNIVIGYDERVAANLIYTPRGGANGK